MKNTNQTCPDLKEILHMDELYIDNYTDKELNAYDHLESMESKYIEKVKSSSLWKKLLRLIKKWLSKDDPEDDPKPDPKKYDEMDFKLLQWKYGGFKGNNAIIDTPRISNLSCNGRNAYYKWDVGMESWGLKHTEAGAIFCIFLLKNTEFVGGKADWVSTSRTSRDFKNLVDYGGWHETLPIKGRIAVVMVSSDGKKRSNVLVADC